MAIANMPPLSTPAPAFEVELTGSVENRGDAFVARIYGLGVAAYGTSVVEAQANADRMVDILMATVRARGGLEAVRRKLEKAGYQVTYPSPGKWDTTARIGAVDPFHHATRRDLAGV